MAIILGAKLTKISNFTSRLTDSKPPDGQDSDTIQPTNRRISFVDNNKALYIPSPRERDRGIQSYFNPDYQIYANEIKASL